MADPVLPLPRWAQRRKAFEAESRGEDGSKHIQTLYGGDVDPGHVVRFNYGRPELRRRITGVGALQRIGAMQAYRARTSLAKPQPSPAPPEGETPIHGEVRTGRDGSAWQYDSRAGKGVKLEPEAPLAPIGYKAPEPATNKPLNVQNVADAQKRKRQLVDGGISAPEADTAVKQEFDASFAGPPAPVQTKPKAGPKRQLADQSLIQQIRQRRSAAT